ncbi:MAG: tetratricopeptide repeat protein [Bacteroidota bacterium]
MKSRFTLLIISFIVVFTGYAQSKSHVPDSLARLLRSATREDSVKVKLLLAYSRCFLSAKPDTALVISRQAVEISQRINFSYGVIRGMNSMAICYWYQNNPRMAIPTFHKALAIAVKDQNADLESMVSGNLGIYYGVLGVSDSCMKYNLMALNAAKKLPDKTRYIKSVSDLGMVFYNKGSYVEAIEYIIESKNYYESNHLLYDLVISYVRLGLVYSSINDFEKSIGNYRKGLQVNDSVKDVKLEMTILQNIGLLYIEIRKNLDSAELYLNRALEMARENHSQETMLSAMANLGNIALDKKEYKEAISIFNDVLKLPQIPNQNKEHAAILVNLGKAYLGLGDIGRAKDYAEKGIKLAEAQKFVTFERTACKILGDIEARKKNYKEALGYYIRYASLQDTLGSAEVKHRIAEIVFQNTLNQKEKENLLLQKENDIKLQTIRYQRFFMFAAGGILLLGFILLVVIVRNNRRQRAMNEVLDQKNKELKELNLTRDKFFSIIAHDLKSPFNGLLGLLTDLDENYDDMDEVSKRRIIGSLKRSSHNTYNLLINLLDWSQSQSGQIKSVPQDTSLSDISKEVLVILSARAEAKHQNLINVIDTESRVYSDPHIIQAMLLNLVNNAIKFTPANGTITLRSISVNGFLQIEVSDTGIGIPPSQVQNLFRIDAQFKRRGTENEPGTGLGLIMCNEFASLLGGEIGLKTGQDSGTTFYFTIPLNPLRGQNAGNAHDLSSKNQS